MARVVGRLTARMVAATTVVAIAVLGAPTPASAVGPPSGKVYVSDVSVIEGNGGTTPAVFTISLSPPRGSVSVTWGTSSVSATAGSDFTASSGTVTVSKTTPSVLVSVPVIGDTVYESTETFNVSLSNAVGGTIGDATGVGTITDDDAQPTISIGNGSAMEGDSGTTAASFAVSLSAPSTQTVTVGYATANGTAVSPSDFAGGSGTLSFSPGQTSKSVSVAVQGDTIDEADETFTVNLSGATNATIAVPQGGGTITDDDTAQLWVSDVTVPEGTGGTTNAVFTVTLGVASAAPVSVDWTTTDGSANAPADYSASSGTVSFSPGQTSKTVSVTVNGDAIDESDESFTVGLSGAVNAPIADGSGTGTITDDDAAPALSVSDVSATEGDAGTMTMTFTVSLNAPSGKTVSVHAATSDGTASAPRDYAASSVDLTFAPGETIKQLDVVAGTDTWFELDETFAVGLSSAVDATIADDTGVGTIVNDDALVGIDVSDATVTEGDSGSQAASFDVTLSGPSGLSTSVGWTTVDGTATAGSDYAAGSGTLTFAPGVTTQTVTVDVLGDTADEPNEVFSVALSDALNAGLATLEGTGTITDDDPAVTTLTMSVKKTKRSVTAKGLLEPATTGMPVTVTLMKKKGSRYVKLSARTIQVKSLLDRDGDSLIEGMYVARFKRPKAGIYKVTATYAGSVAYLATSITKRVKL